MAARKDFIQNMTSAASSLFDANIDCARTMLKKQICALKI